MPYTSVLYIFIIRLTHTNVWESMGKPCSCTQFIKSHIFYYKSRKNPYQCCKSRQNPYQVLQVTRESVSGTTSHVRCVSTCNEIEGSYDKFIITIVPSYTGKISLVCCCWHCCLCCALVTIQTTTNLRYFLV